MSVTTLAALVDAWAALAGAGTDAKPLLRGAVDGVLAPETNVATSERVPQDPSSARAALARALGKALRAAAADDGAWTTLLDALVGDAKARAAAEGER